MRTAAGAAERATSRAEETYGNVSPASKAPEAMFPQMECRGNAALRASGYHNLTELG